MSGCSPVQTRGSACMSFEAYQSDCHYLIAMVILVPQIVERLVRMGGVTQLIPFVGPSQVVID
jgi:hypothetical protein